MLIAGLTCLFGPGLAAAGITRWTKGGVRWFGWAALFGFPLAVYVWQCHEAIARTPPPHDGAGFTDVMFGIGVAVWWVSTAIGILIPLVRRERDRTDDN